VKNRKMSCTMFADKEHNASRKLFTKKFRKTGEITIKRNGYRGFGFVQNIESRKKAKIVVAFL